MWKSYQPSPSWLDVQCSAVSFRLLSFNFNSFDSATLIHSSHCCCSPTSFRLPSSLGFPFLLDVSSVTFSSQFPPASLKEQTQLIMQSIYNMLKQPVPSPPPSRFPFPIAECIVVPLAGSPTATTPPMLPLLPCSPRHNHAHGSFLSAAHWKLKLLWLRQIMLPVGANRQVDGKSCSPHTAPPPHPHPALASSSSQQFIVAGK